MGVDSSDEICGSYSWITDFIHEIVQTRCCAVGFVGPFTITRQSGRFTRVRAGSSRCLYTPVIYGAGQQSARVAMCKYARSGDRAVGGCRSLRRTQTPTDGSNACAARQPVVSWRRACAPYSASYATTNPVTAALSDHPRVPTPTEREDQIWSKPNDIRSEIWHAPELATPGTTVWFSDPPQR